MTEIDLGHYLTLSGIIFTIGIVGIFLNRKNIIIILLASVPSLIVITLSHYNFPLLIEGSKSSYDYAFVNAAVVTGILPVTGLPMPMVSYGGSGMVVNMAMMGILLNISQSRRSVVGSRSWSPVFHG